MMRPPVLALAAALCLSLVAYPPSAMGEALYGPDHPLVRSIELLYSRSNLAFPTATYPLSRRELYIAARHLQRQAHSAAERDRVEAFLLRLEYSPEEYHYKLTTNLVAQAYLPDGLRYDDYADLSAKGNPVATIQIGAWRDSRSALFLQAEIGREFASFDDNRPYTNLPIYQDGIPFVGEYAEVTAAYLHYVLGDSEIVIGRAPFYVGPSPFSSLHVAGEIPFLDAIRLSLPFGALRFHWVVATLENRRARGEPERGELPIGYDYGRNIILYNLQRLEFSHNRVLAGLGVQAITARRDNMFLLSDFFAPVAGLYSEAPVSNLSVVGDLSIVLRPGLVGFVQSGIDALDLEAFGADDSGAPSIFAVLGGVHARSERPGAIWDGVLEIGDTHYLWGSFDDAEYLSRAIYRRQLVGESEYMPLSSPYGPGVTWLRSRVGVASLDGLDFGLELLLRWINPVASLTAIRDDVGAYRDDLAAAAASRDFALGFGGELGYRPWEHTRIAASPAVQLRSSEAWVEIILSVESSFSHSRSMVPLN
ncbi:MAG: hypothetical protein EA428_06465 [Spirochaetaceae bacterium]|nr:MAG: hypothetical protein EA428_06465 [Spirochaetaceae bacterium]